MHYFNSFLSTIGRNDEVIKSIKRNITDITIDKLKILENTKDKYLEVRKNSTLDITKCEYVKLLYNSMNEIAYAMDPTMYDEETRNELVGKSLVDIYLLRSMMTEQEQKDLSWFFSLIH